MGLDFPDRVYFEIPKAEMIQKRSPIIVMVLPPFFVCIDGL